MWCIAAWYFFPIWAQAVIVSFLHILENEILSHIISNLSSIKTFDTVKYEFPTFTLLSTTLCPKDGTNLTWLDKALSQVLRSL